ncbi:MAG: 2-oxoisovalerate dehydrogenase [Deltaproteobacteria bacterium RIFCSPLOWO2_02_FULL_44_10]|nr:MAG: 2-oxoisovalerate dehydrogenase [Deltaproteobacteria bacterium RIFCSPHIGHO2_02_FULL_44_16]OGQ45542.1 MAG: 2-oxoisovalerate dehydrogenase [Deltaproteobacteria bacterium RIFCSPLOWO2_02_FULL_44_10]
MSRDERVIVLGEDVGKLGGVFRATAGLQKKFGKDRVMDTPLAEAGIVGMAIGMAIYGLKPVAEIQFMGFDFLCHNQLMAHAARMRNRTRGRWTVPMVVRMPCGGGIHAPELHSDSFEATYAHIPGLKIVMPSTPHDTKGLLLAAIEDPDPVIFLEHKRIYRAVKDEVPDGFYTVPIGKGERVCEGTDVTIVTWGFMRHLAANVAKSFTAEGVSIEVIDIRSIVPLDEEMILESVRKTGRLIVLHEAARFCGLGAEIAALCAEKEMFSLKAPLERVTGYDITMPLPKGEMMQLPSEARLVHAIRKVMEHG